MLIELALPVLTSTGAAGVAWYLARAQRRNELLDAMAKLKTSLERQKQRNRLLETELELAHTKLQFEGALRSVEVATLQACLPQPLGDARIEQAAPEVPSVHNFRPVFGKLDVPVSTYLLPARKRRRISRVS